MALSDTQLRGMTLQQVYDAVASGAANTLDITAWERVNQGLPPIGGGDNWQNTTPNQWGTYGTRMLPREMEESYSPFTAYLQALGLANKNYYNPAQQYQMNQYDPLSNIYETRRLMGLVNPSYNPGEYGGMWAAGNAGNATALARQTLANLFGFTQEQQGLGGLSFDPQYSGSDTVGTGGVSMLQNLLKTGIRGNLGGYLSSKLPWEQQNWGSAQAAGGTGTFLDYVRQKYNLGSLIA